jgi:hypothetical protein
MCGQKKRRKYYRPHPSLAEPMLGEVDLTREDY